MIDQTDPNIQGLAQSHGPMDLGHTLLCHLINRDHFKPPVNVHLTKKAIILINSIQFNLASGQAYPVAKGVPAKTIIVAFYNQRSYPLIKNR